MSWKTTAEKTQAAMKLPTANFFLAFWLLRIRISGASTAPAKPLLKIRPRIPKVPVAERRIGFVSDFTP